MKKLIFPSIVSFLCSVFSFGGCSSSSASHDAGFSEVVPILTDTISKIVSNCPGEIGVAVIIDNEDTVTVNDRCIYPMMSVFKLHQAIALCDSFARAGNSLDSVISFKRASLDSNTWSPILKEHSEPEISLSIKDLLRYSLIQSDNNASNLMFKRFVDVNATDSMVATIIPRDAFKIAYTEEEMSADHKKAYSNRTSPSGAAMLINRLFTDSLLAPGPQDFIRQTLGECVTGKDRITAPLLGKTGVTVAHKTGSGYMENGILAAHNDVAYITLPGGRCYSMAVFVKDFAGNETEASEIMAHLSKVVYEILSREKSGKGD